MALPQLISHCPLNTQCASRRLYQLGDQVFDMDRNGLFKTHVCKDKFGSKKPDTIYVGVWESKATKRLRYVGPSRQKKSVLKPPPDKITLQRRRTKGPEDWTFVDMLVVSGLDWKSVPKEEWEDGK